MKAGVIGSSLAGMTAALALTRQGIDVTIFESDAAEAPERLGPRAHWRRPGVPQFHQAHNYMAAFVHTMREIAPGFIEDLERAGARHLRGAEIMPPPIADRADEIDADLDELSIVSARRPFLETMLRNRLLKEPGVDLRTGVRVVSLESSAKDGVPHIVGLVDSIGDRYAFDVVIDATGRRSTIDEWLSSVGARPAAFSAEATHQVYFTRYYEMKASDLPMLNNGFNAVQPFPWFVVLVFLGDNGTIQVAMGGLGEDTDFKIVRHPAAFQEMASIAPAVSAWVDPSVSEPISGVSPMGNLNNHIRRLVVDGSPVVTGLHLVGDSAMITNPQYGRGVSHAACHGAFVASVIAGFPDDPRKQVLIVDGEVERMLVPSFESSIRMDRMRQAIWRGAAGIADRGGHRVEIPEIAVDPVKAFAASAQDPVTWHALSRGALLLEPPGAWADDPEIVARIEAVEVPPPPVSPPDRGEVLARLRAVL